MLVTVAERAASPGCDLPPLSPPGHPLEQPATNRSSMGCGCRRPSPRCPVTSRRSGRAAASPPSRPSRRRGAPWCASCREEASKEKLARRYHRPMGWGTGPRALGQHRGRSGRRLCGAVCGAGRRCGGFARRRWLSGCRGLVGGCACEAALPSRGCASRLGADGPRDSGARHAARRAVGVSSVSSHLLL